MNIYTSEVEMLQAQCKEWEKVCNQHLRHIEKLKKQRTWVGLTAQELAAMAENVYGSAHHDDIIFGVEIQAKLKEKNT